MAEHHQAPNYWAVWIWLAVLTVLEVGVTLIPELATLYKAILLVALVLGTILATLGWPQLTHFFTP